LCAYLPAYKSLACNEQNKTITLEQLLTMNTGIPWDEQTYDYIDDRNSLVIASNEKDQFTYLLSLPRHTSNTAVFAYNSLNHTLMNAVLKHATKLNNKSELTKRILKPLGIEKYYLGETNPMGVIGDIDLRPRDMMKFGLLYLNNGQWNGQQLVPALWIKESTTAHLYPTPTLGYGYF
jgi:CubicO group peptidase (beta-lactamase class C family)